MATLPAVRRKESRALGIYDDMNQMLDSLYAFPPSRQLGGTLWHPTVDIYNRKNEIVAELELPGISRKDLCITFEPDHLIVEGTREQAEECEDGERYYVERSYGAFHRVIHLPMTVDECKSKATLKDGLLTVVMPKKRRTSGKPVKLLGKKRR